MLGAWFSWMVLLPIHLGSQAQNVAFGFKFHRRADHRIGKSGNGYQGTGSGVFGNPVVDIQSCQQCRKHNQAEGGKNRRIFSRTTVLEKENQQLPEQADNSSRHKRLEDVERSVGAWAFLSAPLGIFLFCHPVFSFRFLFRVYKK